MSNIEDTFSLQRYMMPGEHLTAMAKAAKVSPKSIMRDYAAHIYDDGLTIAVGDMANNLTGMLYRDEAMAGEFGLPSHYAFNGGLVGSLLLRKKMSSSRHTGKALIELANAALAEAYQKYSVKYHDPAERFTGYLTHARIGAEKTVLTAVGDVNAWVNGEHVIGEEKIVDTEKERLITDLVAGFMLSPQERDTYFMDSVHEFAGKARFTDEQTNELFEMLTSAVNNTKNPDRQTVYKPIERIVTPWQIRTLQNHLPNDHPWAYGAIDGTATPDLFVQTYSIPTEVVESLVIATDGSRPRALGASVYSESDLQAVNPVFSEQTTVVLKRKT